MGYIHLSIDDREVILKMRAQQASMLQIGDLLGRSAGTISRELEQGLDMRSYFARPYHSWERGTNENTNGLLRQFFPKGMDFEKVMQSDVDIALELLNNRPRKCLNYRTPAEVFWSTPMRCASD